MGVTTVSGPALFRHSSSPLVVIMPMNVSWPGDEPEKPPTPASTPEPIPESPRETPKAPDEGHGEQTEDKPGQESEE